MAGFRNALQAASNTAADTVSAPVDGIAWLLRRAGVKVPDNALLGSQWMREQGLTAPVQPGLSQLAGESLGMLAPVVAAAKAPQIARGLLQAGENLAAQGTVNRGGAAAQRGIVNAEPMKPLAYQIDHKPMTKAGGAATLDDLAPAFGEDIYGKNALQYFGSGDPRERAIVRQLAALRGKPDAPVTVYRGVPKDATGINAGDWVTLDAKAAAEYAAQHPGGKVVSMKVPASHVTSWADSLLEFGYHPPQR